jgi:hypothetical protein
MKETVHHVVDKLVKLSDYWLRKFYKYFTQDFKNSFACIYTDAQAFSKVLCKFRKNWKRKFSNREGDIELVVCSHVHILYALALYLHIYMLLDA